MADSNYGEALFVYWKLRKDDGVFGRLGQSLHECKGRIVASEFYVALRSSIARAEVAYSSSGAEGARQLMCTGRMANRISRVAIEVQGFVVS